MKIHISRNGQKMGPYPLDQVNQYLEKGSLLPTDSAWHDGMADWVLLSDVAGVIIPSQDTPPPLPAPKESPVSECSWCKTPVDPDWKICQECGTPLEKDDNIKQVCIHCEGLVIYPDDQTGDIIECPHCKKLIQLRGSREYNPGAPNWSELLPRDEGSKGSSGGGIGIGFEIDF